SRLATFLSNGNEWAGVYAAALCAIFYPLTSSSLLGMEVGILACLVTVATLWAVENDGNWRKQKRALWLLALGMLIRPDVVVVLVAAGVGIALVSSTRRSQILELSWTTAIAAGCVLVSMGVRYWYFGEL